MRHQILAGLVFISCSSLAYSSEQPKLNCDVGPVEKNYGKSPWLMYSCDDNKSLVFVSAPGSPAMPFYFFYTLSKGSYRLTGEGTGSKEATDAAYNELKNIPAADIQKLVAETKLVKKPKQ